MITITSARALILLTYTAPYYGSSNLMANIRQAQGYEFDALLQALQETLQQYYVETSTWDLARWEYELGIITRPGDSDDTRRGRIMTKMKGSPGPFTRQRAILLANVYSLAKTADAYTVDPGKTYITWHDVNDLTDQEAMIQAFADMAPAHLRHIIGLRATVKIPTPAWSEALLVHTEDLWLNNAKLPDKVLDGTWKLEGSLRLDKTGISPAPKWSIPAINITTALTSDLKRQQTTRGFTLNGARKLDGSWKLSGTAPTPALMAMSVACNGQAVLT